MFIPPGIFSENSAILPFLGMHTMIACDNVLTFSRGKTHEAKLVGTYLGQAGQNCVRN